MKNKQIISALVGIAIIGALTGLILEVVIEGDAAKFRRLIQNIEGNPNFLSFPLGSAYMESVQNMISHATVGFELTAIPTDPNPDVKGDEYYLNQISECVFHSSENIPFPTCLICQLTEEQPEKLNCDCQKPTIFTVQYNNPSFPAEKVRIEVYKNEKDFGKPDKLLAEFDGIMDGDPITIDSRDFLTGSKNTVESNTAFRVIRDSNEVAGISIHTSCSQPLFIGDVHEGSNNVDDVAFTVISGTDVDFNPTIPDALCREFTCDCKKPTVFTVQYNNPSFPFDPVRIEVYKNQRDFGNPSKLLAEFDMKKDGDLITIDSREFLNKPKKTVEANTAYRILSGGSQIASISIHTSCSQPLFIDQFFSSGDVILTVVSGFDKNGFSSLPSSTCELSEGAKVLVEGWKILPDGYVASTQESISIPVGPLYPDNDVMKIAAVSLAICAEIPPDCDCNKPTIFTVQYNNPSFPAEEVMIEVYKNEKDFGKPDKLLAEFDGIMDGDPITIDSRDFLTGSKNTVESNTAFRVIRDSNEVAGISIHTSCSQPLFIGDVHEGSNNVDDVAFTVISGTDVNFNPTIPEATCRTEEDVKCKGLTSMTVAYSGPARWIEVNDKKIIDIIIEDTSDPLLSDPPEITVIADGNNLPANTKFKIYKIETNGERGSLIDEIEIHTSCSKPINIGAMHTTAKVQVVLTIIDLDKIFE